MMNIQIKLDDKGLRKGFVDFIPANSKAIQNTFNIAAFQTRKNSINKIKDNFILRNKFTERQIQVEKSPDTVNISQIKSKVGATIRAPYMSLQETGGIRKRKGKATSIPQKKARGGRKTQLVSKQFYISRISSKIVKGKESKSFGSRKARHVARMAVAYREKKFIRFADKIFQVKYFSVSNGRVNARMDLVYKIEKANIRVNKAPWLQPSLSEPIRKIPKTYIYQLKAQWKYFK